MKELNLEDLTLYDKRLLVVTIEALNVNFRRLQIELQKEYNDQDRINRCVSLLSSNMDTLTLLNEIIKTGNRN